jgi:hypothetical protein
MLGPKVNYANGTGAIDASDAFAPRFDCLAFDPVRDASMHLPK